MTGTTFSFKCKLGVAFSTDFDSIRRCSTSLCVMCNCVYYVCVVCMYVWCVHNNYVICAFVCMVYACMFLLL